MWCVHENGKEIFVLVIKISCLSLMATILYYVAHLARSILHVLRHRMIVGFVWWKNVFFSLPRRLCYTSESTIIIWYLVIGSEYWKATSFWYLPLAGNGGIQFWMNTCSALSDHITCWVNTIVRKSPDVSLHTCSGCSWGRD